MCSGLRKDREGFIDRQDWRRDAVAMTATHDLPTVAGWWRGIDIKFRAEQGASRRRKRRGSRAFGGAEGFVACLHRRE